MERRPFREHHILRILSEYDLAKPLDLHIRDYFRIHKSLGSKDRAEIAETIYGIVRWSGLIDFLNRGHVDWESRYDTYISLDLDAALQRTDIPTPSKFSFPQILYDLIIQSLGEKKGHEFCLESNYPAPTTVRINPIETSRDLMLKRWENEFEVSACEKAEHGIVFHKKIHFFSLPEFQAGLFEVQDEGSQLLADLMQVKPGEHVMDYCCGSGGKTLAFAYKMQNKGQIYLHDIRPHILLEAKSRLRRAGVQNFQIVEYENAKLNKLKKKMDWVLVDAPCTGTGTLRRNPDMKWNFTEETLLKLVGQQRVIFEKALSYLKPGGRIVYGTCSVLKQENEEQLEHFIKTYNLEVEGKPFQSLPQRGKMDGFFGVVLKKP